MKRTIGGNAAAWTARSAWNRTDDNGPFARKDNETRKEKAHLIITLLINIERRHLLF